ncbi:MOSC domain-containing protein [Altererythrobacter xixiisoli]|uniref:MOSC domain-containing protein n=2 Tax=Croceibacterium xixiisoli TaxID=1476466 RepID=A0A6I4TUM5_9SPHN|nr:MOSC domain-containing protein [Croceibacterium xixiisoli]
MDDIAAGPFAVGPILVGRAVPFRGKEASAIAKSPADGPIAIGPLGLAGDEQADLSVHGGVDKAIHHYPHDHYAAWRDELERHELLDAPGAFGENISTSGLTEADLCIGDRFRLGTALVEVSQGRQPCWKIDHHFGRKGINARIVTTGRSGWYYRVIESGTVQQGDGLMLQDRPHPRWSVAHTFQLLIGSGHKGDPAAIRALAALPVLATSWRARAEKLRRD